eukprot:2900390-Rhodomonas_salina.1
MTELAMNVTKNTGGTPGNATSLVQISKWVLRNGAFQGWTHSLHVTVAGYPRPTRKTIFSDFRTCERAKPDTQPPQTRPV